MVQMESGSAKLTKTWIVIAVGADGIPICEATQDASHRGLLVKIAESWGLETWTYEHIPGGATLRLSGRVR